MTCIDAIISEQLQFPADRDFAPTENESLLS